MNFHESFSLIESKLKNTANRGSFALLQKEVVETGKCIECGTCVAVCNYNALSWNEVLKKPILGGEKATGKCIACGVCYHECPQSLASEKFLVGSFDKAFITKSKALKGQDGASVSTLLVYLFNHNLIDTAIATVKNKDKLWHPEAIILKSSEDVKNASGSIYAHSQVTGKLIEAIKSGAKKIAIVGCPCKSSAVCSLNSSEEAIFKSAEGIKIYNIGLFCMEAFNPDKLHTILESKGVDLTKVAKMDFSGGKFRIYYKNQENLDQFATFSISSLHDAVETSCFSCTDFTAESADISIGSAGAPDGWNMVLARTPEMSKILEEMIESGVLDSIALSNKEMRGLFKVAQGKKNKLISPESKRKEFNPEQFKLHRPDEWNEDHFHYSPEVHFELYKRADYKEIQMTNTDGSPVIVAKTPTGTKEEITRYQYASTFDITMNLLKSHPKIKGGKVLIKPNNTGFIGVFKHDILAEILKANGVTDDADHQPIATQPAILAGIVDALLELGVKRIDVGENMLWDGGTPRAFYETGYTKIFTEAKYRNKVFFVDFYEDDPPSNCLEKLDLPNTKYCKGDYYNACYPPKALFSEKYDVIIIASVAKSHNCAFYTLSNKNFSVSWNPRKKTGKIEPRWHIHGVPLEIFKPERIKEILGEDFKRKNKIFVREAYMHKWNSNDRYRVVKPKKGQIILSNTLMSSGLVKYFQSFSNDVLDVDPHHWSGINIGLLTLGLGYLINRYTRIFASVLKKLNEQGTEVMSICSGVVGQEGDGPLVYGATKYAGFNAGSFDHTALERVVTDIMYAENEGGYADFLKRRQQARMQEHKITCPELVEEVDHLWTLKIMHDLIGGNLELSKIPIKLLNYTSDTKYEKLTPTSVFQVREGAPFKASLGYYCNPDLWLKLLHNNDSLYLQMFLIERGTIEIPLIPGVVG